MQISSTHIWRQAPFVRLIIPFISGITIQQYLQTNVSISIIGLIACWILLLLFSIKNVSVKYNWYWLSGLFINGFICFGGMMVTYYQDGLNYPQSIKNEYNGKGEMILRVIEPLSEKPKSFKSVASIELLKREDSFYFPRGKIIIYFQKEESKNELNYGSRILVRKNLREIQNNGNPGGFDYQQYCAFQNIHFQVFLKPGEYSLLPVKKTNVLTQAIFSTRAAIVKIIKRFIPGKTESGLAEALLIGYKDDLDKKIVNSYSNTGVIHIIAISGLHVGLIYWLLAAIFNAFSRIRKLRFLKQVLIICGLWIFSIVAGGSPSVLRSAAMFTFIVFGNGFSREMSVYNSLAASAFLLLCYNPFWLWDAGFQLSYAAVLSIVIFMKAIYNLLYIHNKLLDAVWKLNAVTIAAQILTIPICLYYFHQFPTYFLLANVVAVPLSSIILLGEIFLCVVSMLPIIAGKAGWILHWLIRFMNFWVERVERLPFALIENVHFDFPKMISLYAIIIFITVFIFQKWKPGFLLAMSGVFMLGFIRLKSKIVNLRQDVFIVYNVPSHQSIDFISGRTYVYKGDLDASASELVRSSLTPARLKFQVNPGDSLKNLFGAGNLYLFNHKKILLIDKTFQPSNHGTKITLDLVVISRDPKFHIEDLLKFFECGLIIFDSSNSPYKVSKWNKECEQLSQPCYSVQDKGAFVMNLN